MTELDQNRVPVPTPNLRIVPVSALRPHEEHDSQRSEPLIERFRSETVMINPPLVAPMPDSNYVILDGANRFHVFSELGYPHILVQVASYDSGFVQLSNWQHVVAGWDVQEMLTRCAQIPGITLEYDENNDAIAHVAAREGDRIDVCAQVSGVIERNAALCKFVSLYQKNARLHRTALSDPAEIWNMFPDANCMVTFHPYSPQDIIDAAQLHAFLPPGISRHIVQGRALRVNYPLAALCDPHTPLERKNADLTRWLQNKLANRQVRYYAEATYQFDE